MIFQMLIFQALMMAWGVVAPLMMAIAATGRRRASASMPRARERVAGRTVDRLLDRRDKEVRGDDHAELCARRSLSRKGLLQDGEKRVS
jgi:hypothetical protein